MITYNTLIFATGLKQLLNKYHVLSYFIFNNKLAHTYLLFVWTEGNFVIVTGEQLLLSLEKEQIVRYKRNHNILRMQLLCKQLLSMIQNTQ